MPSERTDRYHKLTFSIMYFGNEKVLFQLKESLSKVIEEEELKSVMSDKGSTDSDRILCVENELNAVKKKKQALMKKLADRSIDRETFFLKKCESYVDIRGIPLPVDH